MSKASIFMYATDNLCGKKLKVKFSCKTTFVREGQGSIMNSVCQLILLATILGIVVGDSDVEIVDVTCEHTFDDLEICNIPYVYYQENTSSILNVLNIDTSHDTTTLTISGRYTLMPLKLFELFPKIEKLQISTGLKAITKDNLIDGSKLKILALSRNKIKEITAHTFEGMEKLEFLDLEHNMLTKVESNAFTGATNLKNLVLSFNEIDTIEDGAFNIPALEELDLAINKIQTLADDVFVDCPNLKTISLYGNGLIHIGKSIDNVPKLGFLSLGTNKNIKIDDFDFYATARKPHLLTFAAEGVALVLSDPASAANDDYAAERLGIGGNELSYPDILHRLRNFRNLIRLDIGKNNFATIDDIENILVMFPKLEELFIHQLPCKDEIIERLRAKFEDKISVKHSNRVVIFSENAPDL